MVVGSSVSCLPLLPLAQYLLHPRLTATISHHLHQGLVKVARRHGCEILIASRVTNIDYRSTEQVLVDTSAGVTYTFDLLIGSDGVNSIVRRTLFPGVTPRPPTTNCAYRAIVPYEQIRGDPVAASLINKSTMEVWMSHRAYVISYPISNGKDFNMVLSHHRLEPVNQVEEIDMADLYHEYRDFDPRIKRIIDMIPTAQRWPLLVTGPLESWSSPSKNVVLIGDAAHSMTNHMAQGAATSMEDGAFLGVCIREAIQRHMTLADAIALYERERMPKAFHKQQVSFLNGAIWQLPDGPAQEARDQAMEPELRGEPLLRSPNLYGDPTTVLEVYGYDAEAHAERAVEQFIQAKRKDEGIGIEKPTAEKYMNWFLPDQESFVATC
jgi:salicylate hydroxylase